MQAVCPFSKRS